MHTKTKASTFGLVALLAASIALPTVASADQNSKNTWRNLAIGAGALTGIGLLNHNKTETIIGAAGTAYSLNRYEQDRHHQSEARANREYYRSSSSRRYYWYEGHEYYVNLNTGRRHFVQ